MVSPLNSNQLIVPNAEDYARESGYAQVSMKSMREQIEKLGMNLDDMLGSL